MIGTMRRPAIGSAHQRLNAAFRTNPPSKMADRYVQNCVCFASARIAALFKFDATPRLARESKGMTTSETQARMIPGRLCSGAGRLQLRSRHKLPEREKKRRRF